MKLRISFSLLTLISLFFALPAFAQLGLPQVEEVYGGRIKAIDAVALSATTTRIFISTESANSMFYADVDHSTTPPTFSNFQVIADADTNDGFGKDIQMLAGDDASGWVFFLFQGNLYCTSPTPGSLTTLAEGVFSLEIYDDHLFYIKEDSGDLKMFFGTIDPGGVFTESTNSPASIISPFIPGPNQGPSTISIRVNPGNNRLYIFKEDATPAILYSADEYKVLTDSTTFSLVDIATLDTLDHYRAFGIGPDGRLFLGGVTGVEPNHHKLIAYTDDNGAAWDTVSVPFSGTAGPGITCAGDSANYSVFFGAAMNSNKGEGRMNWTSIGWMGSETHPNDGPVAADPNNNHVIYMTTDQGIGASDTRGETTFEIDEGVEAVQVSDFDMNDGKSTAWSSSKSGIRHVVDYGTPSETWTIMFPNGDGSPYYSIAMDKSDTTGNTAYAGNVRVYKTSDGGNTWSRIFDAQDPAWGFTFWSFISSIKIHPNDPKLVFVGVNSPDVNAKGGIFYSTDGGASWTRLDTEPYNTEVRDFEIVDHHDGTSTIYVACEYASNGTSSSYGVKTITYDSTTASMSFSNDMIGSTGTNITNFGAWDVAVNSNGDVFAAGQKGSTFEPRVYVKYADSTHWEDMPSASLPPNGRVPSLTIGEDPSGNETPFIAVESNIYYFDGSSNWVLGFSYPVGTDINVLFWDDLLVGTGTGLYGHFFENPTGIGEPIETSVPAGFELAQNYPNPFNPSTVIRYSIPQVSRVSLTIYNITGQQIATLVDGVQAANNYQIQWTADAIPSGVYFYRLDAQTLDGRNQRISQVKKMILLK